MKLKSIFIILLVILWGVVIFFASDKTSNESNGKSKKIIYDFSKQVVTVTNRLNITNIDITDEWLNTRVKLLNYPLRKCAHWTIYFILGILLIICFENIGVDARKGLLIAITICFIYSLTDEYHQTFILGRTGQFSDCLIDTFGAIVGGYIAYKLYSKKGEYKVIEKN